MFLLLEPNASEHAYLNWVQDLSDSAERQVVAVDGKTLRRSHAGLLGKNAIHLVSAWDRANRLVLGQLKVVDKSNGFTAIPELLRRLELHGCIVTIDALGCQTDRANVIVERGADYVSSSAKSCRNRSSACWMRLRPACAKPLSGFPPGGWNWRGSSRKNLTCGRRLRWRS